MGEQTAASRVSYPIEKVQNISNKAAELGTELCRLETMLEIVMHPEEKRPEMKPPVLPAEEQDHAQAEGVALSTRSRLIQELAQVENTMGQLIAHASKIFERLDL